MFIVAEGIHSVIRKKVNPKSQIRYSGCTCWRGITDNLWDLDITTETWGPKGRFGIVPIGNDRLYWFATKNAKQNDPN